MQLFQTCLLALTVASLLPCRALPDIETTGSDCPRGMAHGRHSQHGRGGSKEWRRHCGKLECPRYRVCCHSREFEMREYEQAIWAVTTVHAHNFNSAMEQGAERLTAYFHGDNNHSVVMPLTLPLLVTHRPRAHPHPWEVRPYKVALYVHPRFQHKPPAPSSRDVFLVLYNPKPHVIARAFRKCATDRHIIPQARHLWAALDELGKDYLEGNVMVASYNCPWNRGRRACHPRKWHTEVWAQGNLTHGMEF